MKLLVYCVIFALTITSFSCSGDDVMLYHEKEEDPDPGPPTPPEPTYYWLLESVDYPQLKGNDKLNMQERDDFVLTYNEADSIIVIDNDGGDYIKIDYKGNNYMAFSRIRSGATAKQRTVDSLLIYLNENRQIDYALHVTHTETFSQDGDLTSNRQTWNDSTAFKYDAEGYMTDMLHYDYSGNNNSLSYSEKYTIVDGNITEAISADYHHIYTYDDTENIKSSSYVYEMPLNTISIKSRGGCWFMSSLPFLSAKYLGKASKNNVVKTVIKKIDPKGGDSYDYADINYEYTLDENEMLSEVKLKGTVNGKDIPDDFISYFSHFKKEKK
ncbi:hypothetical protein [Prevotella sp. 10(H)]|uniref:hypothetical protein n=1 Tax=Prevotella sp. 10(H) TaxID=1158294 RepID=UPI0004A6B506|nr:hypothetical protein [Prevotella sp. 10(H)]